MKTASVGSPARYVLLALGVLISYLVAEVLTLGVFYAPVLPLSLVLDDVLGLGLGVTLAVLASAMVVSVGVETLIIASFKGKLQTSAPLAALAPSGLQRASLNEMLDDSSRNFVEVFPLMTGTLNVYGAISKEEGVEGYRYLVIEPELTQTEKKQFSELKELLIEEMDVDLRSIESREKAEMFLSSTISKLARTYGYNISKPSMRKLQYYFVRDFIHLGKIEPMMLDPLIEDISCDGSNIPIYIWHRDYESIPTNVIFPTDQELDTFVSKLAYVSGKHISLASPMVDASLTDGSRLHLTYGKEVTQRGSTFTLRKFKADPLTIIDLIKYNTINADVAAYLWYLIEKRMSMLIAGPTASGKSITGDTKVLVYRNGREELSRVDRLFSEAASQGTVRREGMHEVALVTGWETAAFGSDLKVGRHEVKSVVRHRAPGIMYKLITRSGREVVTTGDHSVFTLVDGEVKDYPVSRFVPGMFVAVPRVLPAPPDSPLKIDLVEAFASDDGGMYVENIAAFASHSVSKLGLKQTASILHLRLWELKVGIRKGFLAARVSRFARLGILSGLPIDATAFRIRPKTSRRQSIPALLEITPALMSLLGYWVSEGMYQANGFSLFQTGAEVRGDMANVAKEVFGIGLKPSRGSDDSRLDMHSTVARAVLRQALGLKGGSANKAIPDAVLKQGNDMLSQFLRAYFTGDGWASTYVEACTKSRMLAGQLQYALARFGMVATVRPKFVKGEKYYSVFLYGQSNLKRFAETIGFSSREKQTILVENAYAEKVPHTNVDLIPAASKLLKDVLSSRPENEKGRLRSDWYDYLFNDKRIGRQALVNFVKKNEAVGDAGEKLLTLAYSDIFWDEVVYVEEQPYQGEFVYDLEVPGAQNFVGGYGGIFLHNTTLLNGLSMFIVPGQKVISAEDSVTGDSEILVSESGRVKKVKIGPYVDAALARGSLNTMFGHELSRPSGLRVLTADQSGRVTWGTCTALIRHRVKKNFVKVTTCSGRAVEVTADHSLFTLGEGGDIVELAGGDISEGTYLVAPKLLPVDGTDFTFDLAKLREFSDYWFKPAAFAGGTRAGAQLRVHAIHSPLSIPSVLTLDEDIAFLCGLWVADGFYDDRTVGFSAGGKGIESRIRSIAGLLGVNVTRHSDGISLLIHSKPLKTFFETTLGVTGDDYSRHVPDVFFGATDAVVASFLRGYFSGDGNTEKSEIYAESASRQLLLDLQTLLLRFGIVLSVGRDRKVGTLGGLGTYRAAITERNQVETFKERIGFEQPEKTRKIRPRRKNSKYSLDPIPLPEPLVEELRSGKTVRIKDRVRQRVNEGMKRGAVSRQTVLDLGAENPEFKKTRVYSLATSEFCFDKVVSVERGFREENVYDLSVPETGTFIANNIVCHNTPEIQLPHENWIQEVTRAVGTAQEITLFDLVRNSLRQRPDIIIVGEIRGNEAFTLFQAISTGHGGMSTIHADSVESVFNRLTTDPMNIPRSLVGTTLDCIILQLKLRIGDRSVRRVVNVSEILGFDNRTNEMITNEVFRWDPTTDRIQATGRGRLVDKIVQRYGTKPEEIKRDLESRKVFLDWLAAKNFRSYKEVSQLVQEFYGNPYATASRARTEMEAQR